jgi:phosphomannomutase/phosphoglucomutase
VNDAAATVERVLAFYADQQPALERIDGVSVSFGSWRFNLRSSNTEPLLRLNVEARDDEALMQAKTAELEALIVGYSGGSDDPTHC